MVVSAEYVAFQVKGLIERREQWLRANSLPLNTIMNEEQKEAFLDELKAEYHGSDDQRRRQANDRERGGKDAVRNGKKQRWSRECQRRGGSTQMFHLLSFSGRWDPAFFATLPAPGTAVAQTSAQKSATRAAVEARAQLRLAKKYDGLRRRRALLPYQEELVTSLHDGTLAARVNELTLRSGNGRLWRHDGTFVDIGGSTGGFTRAALYNWTPPNLDEEWQ